MGLSASGYVWAAAFVLPGLAALMLWAMLRARNMQIWIGSYLRRRLPRVTDRPVHVMFCFVDHFEPGWHGADIETQRRRVDRWCRDYRVLASHHRDADGRPPQHSFFYPEEEYAPEHLDKLAELCAVERRAGKHVVAERPADFGQRRAAVGGQRAGNRIRIDDETTLLPEILADGAFSAGDGTG